MKLIVFNGPIFCGKDTAADITNKIVPNSKVCRLKDFLYESLSLMYGLPLDVVDEYLNNRDLKETATELFHGRTPRQAIIHMSEVVIRPNFGMDYIARVTGTRLRGLPGVDYLVFSDGGFDEEVGALTEQLGIDRADVLVIRLHREGSAYGPNDSRYYVKDFDVDLTNDGTIDDLRASLVSVINKHFNVDYN